MLRTIADLTATTAFAALRLAAREDPAALRRFLRLAQPLLERLKRAPQPRNAEEAEGSVARVWTEEEPATSCPAASSAPQLPARMPEPPPRPPAAKKPKGEEKPATEGDA